MIIKAPGDIFAGPSPRVFLAGSIEMGTAVDWQAVVGKQLSDAGATVLSPRRDDWDTRWPQDAQHPGFREQVEWELNAMEHADLILMHFVANTISPITLLELGLYAASSPGKLVVCCPEGFWRKGNVDLVCEHYEAVMVPDRLALVAYAIKTLNL